MDFEEKIEKTDSGFIVKTEVEATENELKAHLEKIKELKVGYEGEVKDMTDGIVLTEKQNKLKEDLNKIDEFKAFEVHKAKIGNVDKRIRELNEAIKTVDLQIKNREELFDGKKE
jgi:hypothetical protein